MDPAAPAAEPPPTPRPRRAVSGSARRHAAVHRSGLETSPAIPGLDRAAALVRTLLGAPAAFVTVVGAGSQSVVAQRGFTDALWVPRRGPLSHSYCRHAVEADAPLVVPDARASSLACAGPLAESVGIGAYLGVPFHDASGAPLGALCAIDGQARAWTSSDVEVVASLAVMVESEVALRGEVAQRSRVEARYRALFDGSPDAVLILDPETERVLDANPAACALYGARHSQLVGTSLRAFALKPSRGDVATARLAADGGSERFDTVHVRADGTPMDLRVSASLVDLGGRPVLFLVNRDVTDLKRAEREAARQRARTDRLAMVAAKTTNGVVVTDADGLTEWVNEGFTRITGYTLDDLRGRKPGSVLQGPGTDPETVRELRGYMRSREPFSAEILNYHRNGDPYWIRIEVTPLVEPDGTLTGFMAIETDVTERRQAEDTLRASEARFRMVTETAGVGLFVSDVDGGKTSFTLPAKAVLGYQAAEPLTFAQFSALTHPDDRDAVADAIAQLKDPAGPGRIDLDHRVVRPGTGEVRWVSVRGEAVFEGEGAARRAVRLVGVVMDATLRKRAEAAARAGEAQYRALVESVRDAVVETDTAGRITFVNPAWARISGVSIAESLGRPVRSFVHPDHLADRDVQFARLHAGDAEFVRFESQMVRPDGETRYIEVQAQVRRDAAGAPEGVVKSVTDITDSTRFHAEREARQRADEMLRLKGAFLSNMSHELRTPLTGILGFADVLADEVDGEHRDLVEAILRGGQRLRDTLNSVLDLAQLEAGSFSLRAEPVDARAAAREALALLHPLAAEAGLGLALAPGSAVWALADESALHRVLHNLVGNAVKFTDAGGVTVAVDRAGDAVRLRVADTGIGISAAFQSRLFDEFTQASEGDARTHEGNGLGLSITHQLVRLMGGEIRVESEEGVGTTFTVDLPAAKLHAEAEGALTEGSRPATVVGP